MYPFARKRRLGGAFFRLRLFQIKIFKGDTLA